MTMTEHQAFHLDPFSCTECGAARGQFHSSGCSIGLSLAPRDLDLKPGPIAFRPRDLDEPFTAVGSKTGRLPDRLNPAPSPIDLLSERAERLTNDVVNETLLELSALRDQLDDTIKRLQARQASQIEGFRRLAADTRATIDFKNVVAENLEKLQRKLEQPKEIEG